MYTNLVVVVALLASPAFAQEKRDETKPRVFVTDSLSWEGSSRFGGGLLGEGSSGGARPQTAEIMKTFGARCTDSVVTINREKADYVIILNHEGGKSVIRKDNKFALFNKEGDAIKSGATRTLGNAVKEACEALLKDWKSPAKKENL